MIKSNIVDLSEYRKKKELKKLEEIRDSFPLIPTATFIIIQDASELFPPQFPTPSEITMSTPPEMEFYFEYPEKIRKELERDGIIFDSNGRHHPFKGKEEDHTLVFHELENSVFSDLLENLESIDPDTFDKYNTTPNEKEPENDV